MPQPDKYTQESLAHVRFLSAVIGGRGSCTPAERRAAEYAAQQVSNLGISDVRMEPYKGSPSTYRPYALALGASVLGTVLMWLLAAPWGMVMGLLLNALGAWGMLAESDFASNWMRWVLPRSDSQNTIGIIPPADQVRRRAILCAHLDTHRTPFFFASDKRFTLFMILTVSAWASMIIEAAVYGLAILFDWSWVFWIGALAVVQAVALGMYLQADRTPFSPGANDNASGVGAVLALGHRLTEEPLAHTEIWLVFTGCEETAAYGIAAFLDAHATELDNDTVYIMLDMVGQGQLNYPTADGLLVKHKAHPRALELARQANVALPKLQVNEQIGIAYTDATLATKRGRIAMTVNALPPPGNEEDAQWHRMSDTLDAIDPQSLADAHAFTWQILQEVDRS